MKGGGPEKKAIRTGAETFSVGYRHSQQPRRERSRETNTLASLTPTSSDRQAQQEVRGLVWDIQASLQEQGVRRLGEGEASTLKGQAADIPCTV